MVVERGINYPRVLGKLNLPPEERWGGGRNISNLPSIIPRVLDRSFLPQILPPRGTGLITGTARTGLERGRGIPLGPLQRLKRHKGMVGQIVPRRRLVGTLGILNPQTLRNIPKPWGTRTWPASANVGGLPSIVQTGSGVSGPTRSMHPSTLSVVV